MNKCGNFLVDCCRLVMLRQGMGNIKRTSYFYIVILLWFLWEDMTVFLGFYTIIYLLTPRSRVLEKLTSSQLVKKFPAFYGTRMFITALKRARHLSLSWARSIQAIPPHPTSWWSILILSSYLSLGLPSGLFLSGILTKTLFYDYFYTSLLVCSCLSFWSLFRGIYVLA